MLWHNNTPTCPTWSRSRQIMSSTSLTLRSLRRTMICLVSHLRPVLLRFFFAAFFVGKNNCRSVFFWIIDIYDFPIYLVTVNIEASLDMECMVRAFSWSVERRKLGSWIGKTKSVRADGKKHDCSPPKVWSSDLPEIYRANAKLRT